MIHLYILLALAVFALMGIGLAALALVFYIATLIMTGRMIGNGHTETRN